MLQQEGTGNQIPGPGSLLCSYKIFFLTHPPTIGYYPVVISISHHFLRHPPSFFFAFKGEIPYVHKTNPLINGVSVYFPMTCHILIDGYIFQLDVVMFVVSPGG